MCAFLPILPFIFHLSQSQKLEMEQAVSPDAGVFQVICTRTYSLACYAVRQLKLSGKNTKLKTMPAVFLFVSAFSFSSLLATVRLIPPVSLADGENRKAGEKKHLDERNKMSVSPFHPLQLCSSHARQKRLHFLSGVTAAVSWD